jgi:hypothetical protein
MPFSIVTQIHVVLNVVSKFNVSLMQEIKQLDLNIAKKKKNNKGHCFKMYYNTHVENDVRVLTFRTLMFLKQL